MVLVDGGLFFGKEGLGMRMGSEGSFVFLQE